MQRSYLMDNVFETKVDQMKIETRMFGKTVAALDMNYDREFLFFFLSGQKVESITQFYKETVI